MSNTHDLLPHIFNSAPAARVSYTLNNAQPVICSYIGQEPLFYFDEPAEDNAPSDIDFTAEFESMDQQLSALDKLSQTHKYSVDEYIDTFEAARNSITGQNYTSATSFASVEDLLTTLSQSRIAKAYIDHAKELGTEFVFDATQGTTDYDRATSTIRIQPNHDQAYQVLATLGALRTCWQRHNGGLVHPLNFQADNAILINRMQQADRVTAIIRGAWELKLSGFDAPWTAIENSSLSDLARAFAREAHMNFRTIDNGLAMTSVFEAWFLSERCRETDKSLINAMLTDAQGFVFDIDNEHASLTPAIIAALGTQPFGKNYLSSHVQTIMNDPIFTEVRDRSSANFLWFIKFERSFRETERDLQQDFSSAAGKAADNGMNIYQGQSDENNVTVLYDKHTSKPRHGQQHTALDFLGSEDSANIVYLRREPRNHG